MDKAGADWLSSVLYSVLVPPMRRARFVRNYVAEVQPTGQEPASVEMEGPWATLVMAGCVTPISANMLRPGCALAGDGRISEFVGESFTGMGLCMTTSTGIMASFKRSVRRNRTPKVEPGFRPAFGLPYVTFFERLHAQCAFDWYMEIGCRSGQIFQRAQGPTIAVDPFFQVERNVIGSKPALFTFQETSDDFFASGFLLRNDIRLSVSFLDGMHLMEFLLRDFMNTEACSREDSIILMHDCSPYDHAMTSRDYEGRHGLPWTGDVWKLIPILQEHRPDLTVEVLDCAPTGLVAVRGLSPGNQTLRERYDRIVRDYSKLTLRDFGTDRFFTFFDHVSASAEAEAGFPRFRPAMSDLAGLRRPERSSP